MLLVMGSSKKAFENLRERKDGELKTSIEFVKNIKRCVGLLRYYFKKATNHGKGIRDILNVYSRKKERNRINSLRPLLKDFFRFEKRDFSKYQKDKLLEILTYAYDHCEYYKKIFDEINLDRKSLRNFEKIPLLDKQVIRKNHKGIVSNQFKRELYYEMNTGGSTGEPLIFLGSYTAGIVDKIHLEFLYKKMGYVNGDKIFAFGGKSVPLPLREKNIYWIDISIHDIPYGRLSYSSLYLNKKNIKFYVKHIFENKPKILIGYPSFLNEIAEYIIKKNININSKIKGILLTAEKTHLWQIANIEKAFKTKVYLQYGHSEASVFGFTCNKKYEYVCSPIYGYTEILNSKGGQVKIGEIGEIVVTGFWNKAQPFIRYKTGDLAIYNGNKNSIMKFKEIVGRDQDYVYNKDMRKIALTALIFGQHLHSFKTIKKWQLIQEIPGEVFIKIIKDKKFSEKNIAELSKIFMDIGKIKLKLKFVDKILLTKRGKYRFLIQKISSNSKYC